MDAKLLTILRCPISKQKLKLLDKDSLKILCKTIHEQKIQYQDGEVINDCPAAALITENSSIIYIVADGLPVMLEEKSIDNTHLNIL